MRILRITKRGEEDRMEHVNVVLIILILDAEELRADYLTHSLPWSGLFPEKLTVPQLVEILRAFYGPEG